MPSLLDIFGDLSKGREKETAARDRKEKFQIGEITCSDLTDAEKKKSWASSCNTAATKPEAKGTLANAITNA